MVHPLRHPTSTRNILHVVVVRWTTTRRALSTLSCDTNDVDGDGGGDTSMLQRSYGPRHRHMCMWTVLLLNWSRMGEDVPIAVLLEYNEHGMEEAVVDHHYSHKNYNLQTNKLLVHNVEVRGTTIMLLRRVGLEYIGRIWKHNEEVATISNEKRSCLKCWCVIVCDSMMYRSHKHMLIKEVLILFD